MTGLQYNVSRAAYEAYHEAYHEALGRRPIPWDELASADQRAWFQVAKAVIERMDDALAGQVV